jgi:hypothetical protein
VHSPQIVCTADVGHGSPFGQAAGKESARGAGGLTAQSPEIVYADNDGHPSVELQVKNPRALVPPPFDVDRVEEATGSTGGRASPSSLVFALGG